MTDATPTLHPGVETPGLPDAAASTTGARVLAGGAWTGLSQALPQIYILVLSVVAARFLSLDDMGRQSFIAFTESAVISVATLGLAGALVRYVGESVGRGQPEVVRGLVRWAWRLEIIGALAGAGGLVLAGSLQTDLRAAWSLAGAGVALGVLITIPTALLVGLQRFRESSVIALVVGFSTTVATVVVLANGGGITGMFVVHVVGSAVALAWASLVARRLAPRARATPPSRPLRRGMTRYAAANWLSFVLTIILWRRSEFFFLERYSEPAQIALYSVAYASVNALTSSLEAVTLVVSPAVATLSGAGALDRVRTGFGRAVRLVATLSMPITAGAMAVGPVALRVVYGGQYHGTQRPLLILLAAFPFLPLMTLSSGLLTGLGRMRGWLIACVGASVVNLTLDMVLVPSHGAVGAAVANTGAQAVAAVAIIVIACRVVHGVDLHPWLLGRTFCLSLVTGVGGWVPAHLLGGAVGVLLGIAAGVLVFGVGAAVVGVLTGEDAAWLDEAVGHRLPRVARRLIVRWGRASTSVGTVA